MIVDCVPPDRFVEVVGPAVKRGRTVVTVSATALLDHPDVIEDARRSGGRIILATGSVLGLDALRAASVGTVHSVLMTTRKPPASLANSAWVKDQEIDTRAITSPTRIFEGTAREAARLMGVPDDYPLPPRYNDAYHLFGDGLAVPVVSYLERELLRGLVSAPS